MHSRGRCRRARGSYYAQLQGLQTWSYQEDHAWTGLAALNARRQLDLSRSFGVAPGPSRADYVRRLCGP